MIKRERTANWSVYARYADPQHAFNRIARSPKPIAEQWRELGVRMSPWPRTAGNEEAMVEAVRQRIGRGLLKVFATCTNTIAEFQNWSYKRTAKGELPPGEDAFEDRNNHCMDVVKSVVATDPKPARPPVVIASADDEYGDDDEPIPKRLRA